MRTAFLHLDGADYELQAKIERTDDQAFHDLQAKLQRVLVPDDKGLTQVRSNQVTGPVVFGVRINGCDADLAVAPRSMKVAAVYLRPAPAAPQHSAPLVGSPRSRDW